MSSSFRRLLLCVVASGALLLVPAAAYAGEEQATWALEQPAPPPSPPGVPPAPVAVGLGTIGDLEFWSPSGGPPQAGRGVLITSGNGTAVPPGVWAYNGVRWHELANVCGATSGRVAWSGPEEFWTVSDGRPGQVAKNSGGEEEEAPLQDNTLCHFAGGQVAGSYAHLAFLRDSYRAMDAAACVAPTPPAVASRECWFGGAMLPAGEVGAFQLHWNGTALEEQPEPEGHAIHDMRSLESAIFESVEVENTDPKGSTFGPPPVMHVIEAGAVEPETNLPLYSPLEPAQALEGLRLASAGANLWAAAGASGQPLSGEQQRGQVTVIERSEGIWRQIFGPNNPLPEVFSSEAELRALVGEVTPPAARAAPVTAFAVEPGSEDAWLALGPRDPSRQRGRVAALVHINSAGEVLAEQTLPSPEERTHGIGPKGSAVRLACPAPEDCWMATREGWLYHLATQAERAAAASGTARSEMSAFPESLIISERPPDQGVPQEVVEAPPSDTSGINEEHVFNEGTVESHTSAAENTKVVLPLVSRVKDHLRGTTLELRFHLSVKARVQLIAKRKGRVIAKTANRTFAAGNRSLRLHLNPRAWPTKLNLKTKALEPLKEVSSVTGEGANITTESTGFQTLVGGSSTLGPGWQP